MASLFSVFHFGSDVIDFCNVVHQIQLFIWLLLTAPVIRCS